MSNEYSVQARGAFVESDPYFFSEGLSGNKPVPKPKFTELYDAI